MNDSDSGSIKGVHKLGKWCLNGKKSNERYPRFYSGKHRNKYVHRVIFEDIAGRPVKPGFQVHHMNGTLCFCPHQLLECPPEFNVNGNAGSRDPYTGRFISKKDYEYRYGVSRGYEEVPF